MIKKSTLRSYWFWFILLVLGYSVYDYLEHILRPDSVFEEHPYSWLFFSAAAIGSLILLSYYLSKLIHKLLKLNPIISDLAGFGIWLALYLNLLGPIFNKLLFPQADLHFRFAFSAFFVLLGIFFAIRMIFWFFFRNKKG